MTQKERIEVLEREVADLRALQTAHTAAIAALQAACAHVPTYPYQWAWQTPDGNVHMSISTGLS